MSEPTRLRVIGVPIPQGSKKAFVNTKVHPPRAIIVDDNSEALKRWRREVTTQARNAIGAGQVAKLEGPVEVAVTFLFERPQYHYGSGRNAHLLGPKATTYVQVRPDLDKLLRAVLDALTDAQVYTDDSQVVRFGLVEKRYIAAGEPPGAQITIRPVDIAITTNPPTPPSNPHTPGALF